MTILERLKAIRGASRQLIDDGEYLHEKQVYSRKSLIAYARIVAVFSGIYGVVVFLLQLSQQIPVDLSGLYLILFGILSYVFSFITQKSVTDSRLSRIHRYVLIYSALAVFITFFLWLYYDSISMFLFVMITVCNSRIWTDSRKYTAFTAVFTASAIFMYLMWPPLEGHILLYILDYIIIALFAIGMNIAHSEEHYRVYSLKCQLEAERDTDALTGLHNRKTIDRDFSACTREKPVLGVIVLDIDRFKLINDTFGHETGDNVLAEVARLLRSSFRPQDYLARIGGDEFVILMPCSRQDSQLIKSCTASLLHHFPIAVVREKQEVNVTLSVGVCIYDVVPDLTLNQVLAETDRALYEAKNSGRSKAVLYVQGSSAPDCILNSEKEPVSRMQNVM